MITIHAHGLTSQHELSRYGSIESGIILQGRREESPLEPWIFTIIEADIDAGETHGQIYDGTGVVQWAKS